MTPATTRLIVGAGYLGQRVARRWLDQSDSVHLMTRSVDRADAWRQQGYRAIVADLMRPESLTSLPTAETVLVAVGHDRQSRHSLRDVYVRGLAHLLAALPRDTGRVIYISSTGVYGDADSEWVDEETPCHPQRPGGRACLEAEELLLAHPLGARSIILRLAGLYGPDRLPRRAELLAGNEIPAPASGRLNLIHVEDAASAVLAAATANAILPRRYVVSDGRPPQRREYLQELARLLGAPPPRFVDPPPDDPQAQRSLADKRIRPDRFFKELGVSLAYPSFREGLQASL